MCGIAQLLEICSPKADWSGGTYCHLAWFIMDLIERPVLEIKQSFCAHPRSSVLEHAKPASVL